MTEWLLFIVSGIILFFATLLVAQDFFCFYWIRLTLIHPWDHVAHFVVSFAGVYFFLVLFRKIFGWEHGTSLVLATLIMISAGFFKEIILDPYISMKDTAGNLLGTFLALFVLF